MTAVAMKAPRRGARVRFVAPRWPGDDRSSFARPAETVLAPAGRVYSCGEVGTAYALAELIAQRRAYGLPTTEFALRRAGVPLVVLEQHGESASHIAGQISRVRRRA